jgi:hypothetical protein
MLIIMGWQVPPAFPGDPGGEVVVDEVLLIFGLDRALQPSPSRIHRAFYFNFSFNGANRSE